VARASGNTRHPPASLPLAARASVCAALPGQPPLLRARRARLPPCPACPAAPGPSATYTSKASGVTFYFNSSADHFDNSEAGCALGGGHLATYSSIEEQADVEGYVSSPPQAWGRCAALGAVHCCMRLRLLCRAEPCAPPCPLPVRSSATRAT
jgi:hypothetical protein